ALMFSPSPERGEGRIAEGDPGGVTATQHTLREAITPTQTAEAVRPPPPGGGERDATRPNQIRYSCASEDTSCGSFQSETNSPPKSKASICARHSTPTLQRTSMPPWTATPCWCSMNSR